MDKKGLNPFGKKKPIPHKLRISEDVMLPRKQYIAEFKAQRTKKDPGFDKTVDPYMNNITVSAALGSDAPLQLDSGIPDRVLEHTQAVHRGKKRRNRGRRRY